MSQELPVSFLTIDTPMFAEFVQAIVPVNELPVESTSRVARSYKVTALLPEKFIFESFAITLEPPMIARFVSLSDSTVELKNRSTELSERLMFLWLLFLTVKLSVCITEFALI